MDRRSFFLEAVRKASERAVKHADSQVSERAQHWIRPPYALDELEFLLACTRCGECISACAYEVIFPLSARLGAQVARTPAMDLLNKGCHLCEDWPCVTACEEDALWRRDDTAVTSLPALAMATINTEACLPYIGPECGACAGSCPTPEAFFWAREQPRISQEYCIGCGLCREACIVTPKAINIMPRATNTEQVVRPL